MAGRAGVSSHLLHTAWDEQDLQVGLGVCTSSAVGDWNS